MLFWRLSWKPNQKITLIEGFNHFFYYLILHLESRLCPKCWEKWRPFRKHHHKSVGFFFPHPMIGFLTQGLAPANSMTEIATGFPENQSHLWVRFWREPTNQTWMFKIGASQPIKHGCLKLARANPHQISNRFSVRFSWLIPGVVRLMFLPHNFHPGNALAKRSSWRFTTWPGNSATIFGRSHTQRQQTSCSRIWSSSERCAAFWAQEIAKGFEEAKFNSIHLYGLTPHLGLWCCIFGHLSWKVLQHIVYNQSMWRNSTCDIWLQDITKQPQSSVARVT